MQVICEIGKLWLGMGKVNNESLNSIMSQAVAASLDRQEAAQQELGSNQNEAVRLQKRMLKGFKKFF